jgi:hypothetical protein
VFYLFVTLFWDTRGTLCSLELFGGYLFAVCFLFCVCLLFAVLFGLSRQTGPKRFELAIGNLAGESLSFPGIFL